MIFESAGQSRYLRLTKILQILWPGDRVKYGHGREGAQAEYLWQVGKEKVSRHPRDLLRCPLGRKGVADFPPLAYAQNRN